MERRKGFLSKYTTYDKKKSLRLLLMCLPTILKTFIFAYLPMIWLLMAFQDYVPRRGLLYSPWVGWRNFEYLIKSSLATRLISNAVILNVLFIIFGTVISLILGLFLFEVVSKKFVKTAQIIMIFPYFASWPLVDVLLSSIIGTENGMLTKWLEQSFGVIVDFYAMGGIWKGLLTFVYVWKVAGLSAVVYYAILIGVDKEIYDAASIDGAGRFRTMRSISLPFLQQMIILNVIMSSANILRVDFNMIYYVTENKSSLYPATDVIETYMFRVLRTEGDVSVTAATSMIQGVVGLVLTLILNYFSKKVLKESLY